MSNYIQNVKGKIYKEKQKNKTKNYKTTADN